MLRVLAAVYMCTHTQCRVAQGWPQRRPSLKPRSRQHRRAFSSFPPRCMAHRVLSLRLSGRLLLPSWVVNLTAATLTTWDHRPNARMTSVFKHQHFGGGQSSWHEARRFGHAAQPGEVKLPSREGPTDRPTDHLQCPLLREGGQVGRETLRPPEFSAGPKW